jgi:hypothetical protein
MDYDSQSSTCNAARLEYMNSAPVLLHKIHASVFQGTIAVHVAKLQEIWHAINRQVVDELV